MRGAVDVRRQEDVVEFGQPGGEKGFSLGGFVPRYLEEFCCVCVRQEGKLVAFANLWLTPEKTSFAMDLMRYADDAPKNVMDFLFVELLLWGQAEGYGAFAFGASPRAHRYRKETLLQTPMLAIRRLPSCRVVLPLCTTASADDVAARKEWHGWGADRAKTDQVVLERRAEGRENDPEPVALCHPEGYKGRRVGRSSAHRASLAPAHRPEDPAVAADFHRGAAEVFAR